MVRTLIFDADRNATEVFEAYRTSRDTGDVVWSHLSDDEDKVLDIIMDELKKDEAFEEDFLEDQRPRLSVTSAHAIIVIGAPVKAILNTDDPDDGIIQVSFMIRKDKLISVSTRKSMIIDRIMDSYLSKKALSVDATSIFSRIFEQIVENVIRVSELLEKKADVMQQRILRGEDMSKVMQEVSEIKENIHYTQKILRADIEVVREILFRKTELIDYGKFNSHIEDRLLYALDLMDVARESLNNLHHMYMAAISNKLNAHVYRLTLLGVFFFVPAVVASFWGMNVDTLPIRQFWPVVLLAIALTAVLFVVLRVTRKNQQSHKEKPGESQGKTR